MDCHVAGGGWRFNDPPVRARHHGHPHLPSLTVIPANRRPRWRRTQGQYFVKYLLR